MRADAEIGFLAIVVFDREREVVFSRVNFSKLRHRRHITSQNNMDRTKLFWSTIIENGTKGFLLRVILQKDSKLLVEQNIFIYEYREQGYVQF